MLSQGESHKNSELQKIGSLLSTAEDEIDFLSSLPADKLSFLRMKITTAILEEQSGVWEPLARVSKFMPNFLNAKVSEDILGPKITANITYHVPVKDALSIATHFSTKFFCDVLEHIVPEKIEHIIRDSPNDLMKRVVHELRKRKNYLLIGSLIDFTPISSVHKISMEVDDSEMIQIMDYITKRERLAELLDIYDDTKIIGLTKASIKLEKIEGLLEVFSFAKAKTKQKIERILDKLSYDEKSKYKNPAGEFGITII
ncbi:MAG: hypothetical protein EBS19_00765 [Spirochaetia bacterium]|nr:hypothetical protein [Spirochaetia bacterium]